jgi:hypothetical protein
MLPCPIDASTIPPVLVLPTDDNRSVALHYTQGMGMGMVPGLSNRQSCTLTGGILDPMYHSVILALGFTSHNTTKPGWEPLYILPLLLPVQYKTTNN